MARQSAFGFISPLVSVKLTVKILSNFVVFLENTNFKALEDHLKTLEEIPCPFCRSRTIPSFGAYKTHKSR